MDIKASYNWLKEYIKTDLSPADFARELTLRSMPVEYVTDVASQFENMVVGEVVEVRPHPNADKLRLVDTAVGSDVVQIVCGGSNVEKGMKVFVALPGAKVRWHGEGELIELKETKIRGEVSVGMICAPEEVGFEKAPCPKDGIWDLTPITDAAAGTPIADAFDLHDTMLDVEITTNRPDAMGIVGLAREAATATSSDFLFEPPALPEGKNDVALNVTVEDFALCPRYMAVVMDGVKVGPSPLWLQMRLLQSGHRPINNIVDITNYVLHEYGQPMHAFDYDTLKDGTIVVRPAKDGETLEALDEQTYELTESNLVIADSERPVAVAGVMGGLPTGTTEKTTRVVFEAACFEPVSVRKTARALNLYSDSQLLFEKGLSAQAPEFALARAVELTKEIAGGEVVSDIVDVREGAYEPLVFPLRPERVRKLIGVDISDDDIIDTLARLGFTAEKNGEQYSVTVPYWRDHDIEGEVDFTEEVGRMYGYHNIEPVLPESSIPQTMDDPELRWESMTRTYLASVGYTEFYGNSFTSAAVLEKYGEDLQQAVQLLNPLSADHTHLRTSLVPTVLHDIERNQGNVAQAQIFELARVYHKQEGELPFERSQLVFGAYGASDVADTFAKTKGVLEAWAERVGLTLDFVQREDDPRWHPTRTATILHDGKEVGVLGQVGQDYEQAFKIDRPVVLAVVELYELIRQMKKGLTYTPIPEHPAVTRDVAIVLDMQVPFVQMQAVCAEVDGMIRDVTLTDTYVGTGVEEGKKSVTLSFTLRADDRTLTSEEVDGVMARVVQALEERFGVEIR